MAKKKAADAEEGKKGGKGKKIVPVVLLLVGLLAGKMFFAPKKSAEQVKAAAAAAEQKLAADCAAGNGVKMPVAKTAESTTTTTAAESTTSSVLEEDAVTVNLADNHYLKIGLALQLPEGTDVEKAKTDGVGAKALDMAIAALSAKTMAQLSNQTMRTDLKHQLGYEVCKAYKGEVSTVYFTNFVMQ
jgi:flagellar FliL protein